MREHDIRPEHLLRRYLELSAEDAERCFASGARQDIPCVACGGTEIVPEFEKNGFGYGSCRSCGTLYQTPRPSSKSFEVFYRDSVSSRYWAEEFFPAVAEARRESIFRPRVEQLASLLAARGIIARRLVDVGAGFGIFLEEWRSRFPNCELLAIEPSAKLAQVCRKKGFVVEEATAEQVTGHAGYADLVVCFEVLEHVYDPVSFLRVLYRLARPEAYVLVSTLGVDGFDIQTLWQHSNSIFPPHHINFLSVRGFEAAFLRAGFTDVQVTTPGKLDVDIVRNAYKSDPAVLGGNRFARLLVADESRAKAFQEFLAASRLSSHCWVLGLRPAGAA